MAKKHITDEQLGVLRAIVAGKSFEQIKDELGIPTRTAKRWKSQFAGLLSESDAAIASVLLEARCESANLVVSALDELGRLLRTSETTEEKLAVVDRVFRAHTILNPPVPVGSVAISQENREQSYGQVIVSLPDNNRG